VIPDGDRQDVACANTVFPVFDLLIQIRICLRFRPGGRSFSIKKGVNGKISTRLSNDYLYQKA
jgi:hypothetical protein